MATGEMMRFFLIFYTSRGICEIWAVYAKYEKTTGEMMRTGGFCQKMTWILR